MERISSAQTFFMKRVFPCIWLGGVTPRSPAFRFNVFKRNEIAERLIERVDQARNSGEARR
jgi:hypothetical protein